MPRRVSSKQDELFEGWNGAAASAFDDVRHARFYHVEGEGSRSPRVSRGVVLWPDELSRLALRGVWEDLAARGLPSRASHTHRLHQPHVSLAVAEDLAVEEALGLLGTLPPRPIRLRVESAGVFPGGVLFLACVMHQELLDEQRRVHDAAEPVLLDIKGLSVAGW